jgi:hypothetical protein
MKGKGQILRAGKFQKGRVDLPARRNSERSSETFAFGADVDYLLNCTAKRPTPRLSASTVRQSALEQKTHVISRDPTATTFQCGRARGRLYGDNAAALLEDEQPSGAVMSIRNEQRSGQAFVEFRLKL